MTKHITRLIAAILAMAFTSAYAGDHKEPNASKAIKFDERIYSFGTIEEADGPVSHTFRFTNTGDKPLSILYARSGCVCISTDIPRTPVAPGESANITVTYNPLYRPGDFSKEIVVMNSDKEYSRVWVKGTVNPMQHSVSENFPYEYGDGLWMNLGVMSFGRMKPGEHKSVRLRMANDSDFVMRLSFETENADLPDGVTLIIPASHILQPGADASMNISVDFPNQGIARECIVKVYPVVNGHRLATPLEVKLYPVK